MTNSDKETERSKTFDVGIVGAGLVGLSTAYKILQSNPELKIKIFEASDSSGAEQSSHNSEVLHSGLYYEQGSFKSKLCNSHRDELIEFCEQRNVPFEIGGKLVLATKDEQIVDLENLFENGLKTGLPLELLSEKDILRTEKRVRGKAAILSPGTGSVEYKALAQKLENVLREKGVVFHFGTKIESLNEGANGVTLRSRELAKFSGDRVIFAAAGGSLKFAKSMGLAEDLQSIPFKGVYRQIFSRISDKHIYPVPDPRFPFLGVHITNHIDGSVSLGPNASPSLSKWMDKDAHTDERLVGLREGLAAIKFAKNYPATTIKELFSSVSRLSYLSRAQELVPDLRNEEVSRDVHFGVRHQIVNKKGYPISDFKFQTSERALFVLNAPSPAATACFAIGNKLQKLLESF